MEEVRHALTEQQLHTIRVAEGKCSFLFPLYLYTVAKFLLRASTHDKYRSSTSQHRAIDLASGRCGRKARIINWKNEIYFSMILDNETIGKPNRSFSLFIRRVKSCRIYFILYGVSPTGSRDTGGNERTRSRRCTRRLRTLVVVSPLSGRS